VNSEAGHERHVHAIVHESDAGGAGRAHEVRECVRLREELPVRKRLLPELYPADADGEEAASDLGVRGDAADRPIGDRVDRRKSQQAGDGLRLTAYG